MGASSSRHCCCTDSKASLVHEMKVTSRSHPKSMQPPRLPSISLESNTVDKEGAATPSTATSATQTERGRRSPSGSSDADEDWNEAPNSSPLRSAGTAGAPTPVAPSQSSNKFDDVASPEQLVEAALSQARECMGLENYEVLAAEEVLAQALASLETRLGRPGADAKVLKECLARLKSSDIFTIVCDRVAQFDGATEILYNEDMETLFENETGRFELRVAPDGTWFDYRMTVDIDAPLAECLATGNEMDLVPQAQPLVSSANFVGDVSGFNLKYIFRLSVLVFRIELLVEIIRHRGRKAGYLLEVTRSEWPHASAPTPKKPWGTVRPWIYCTNLWMPRGNGKPGTTIVQVTRVDVTVPLSTWVLNFVFKKMSTTFIADLRASALKASQADSPWASRIREDAAGFYRELRKVEALSQTRQEVSVKHLPGREIFERPWRLHPPAIDTRPPSSRGAAPFAAGPRIGSKTRALSVDTGSALQNTSRKSSKNSTTSDGGRGVRGGSKRGVFAALRKSSKERPTE